MIREVLLQNIRENIEKKKKTERKRKNEKNELSFTFPRALKLFLVHGTRYTRLKSFSITSLGQLIGPEMKEGRWPSAKMAPHMIRKVSWKFRAAAR